MSTSPCEPHTRCRPACVPSRDGFVTPTPSLLARELVRVRDVQLSPDGMRTVYELRRPARGPDGIADLATRYAHELRLLDVADGRCAALSVPGEDAGGARWSADAAYVAYVAASAARHELRVRALARPHRSPPATLACHSGRIADLAWSPDGAQIAYVAPAPEPPVEGSRPQPIARSDFIDTTGAVRRAGEARHVFICAQNGAGSRQLTSGALDRRAPAYAPDGRWIAAVVAIASGGASQLELLAPDGTRARRLGPPDGRVASFAWAPDGERILLAGETRAAAEGSAWDLFLADPASGVLEPLVRGRPWAWGDGPVWIDEDRALLHVVEAGESVLYTLDVARGALAVLARGGLRDGLSVSRDGRFAVQAREDGDRPAEVVAIDTRDGAERTLARPSAPLLARARLAPTRRERLAERPAPLDAWVLYPSGFDPMVRHPLVIELHGGPHWWFGARFEPRQQCLVARGFVVAGLNLRGSDSYGRAHAAWINDRWGAELGDVLRALDVLLARPYLDPRRVGLMGFSYGGYLTAWVLAHSDRFAAAVCGCPVFDLESWLATSNEGPAEHGFGSTERKRLDARSPSSFAARIATPTLLLHGDCDPAAPVGQGDAMYRALERAGCPVAYVRYPGAGHALLEHSPAYAEDVLTRVAEWFEQHLGA